MGCEVIVETWTLSGLVGAYLDLAITFLLLCCSSVAFIIANVLALLGLSLPCPCNGLFGYPYRGPCFQRFLVDSPTHSLSSLHFSVKNKFPFDAILSNHNNNSDKQPNAQLEIQAEPSYDDSSTTSSHNHRQKALLRRRRRGSLDFAKLSSASFYDHIRPDVRIIHHSPSGPSKVGSELNALDSHEVQDTSVAPRRTLPNSEANDASDDDSLLYDNATSFENLKHKTELGHGLRCHDENTVRILEQALELEQSARAALCSELDQERIAAATAADEAVAMISRLQVEKASIEIEARQYQRISEEKSAYDAEEMNLLKEIIVRREREKHFLEKEVEEYRKMLQENEELEDRTDDTQGQDEDLDCSVDPMLMLPQLCPSIDERGNVPSKSYYCDFSSVSIEKQTSTVSLDKELSTLEYDSTKTVNGVESFENLSIDQHCLHAGDESSQDIQEKGILSVKEVSSYPQLSKSTSFANQELFENCAIPVRESVSGDNVFPQLLLVPGDVKIDKGKRMQKQASDPHVHDVHIINSKCDIHNRSSEKRVGPLLNHRNASNDPLKSDPPFGASNFQKAQGSVHNNMIELDISRSCSEIDRISALSTSPHRNFVSELRRNSLSAVDQEMLKIDGEIVWLRAKLRAVQGEKEKLKSSLECQELGKTKLQLLEDIAIQLREIQHLTKPEKAVRQASLPPLSSKGTSKKRRSRSVSGGVSQSAST